jgi:hypothetical protein
MATNLICAFFFPPSRKKKTPKSNSIEDTWNSNLISVFHFWQKLTQKPKHWNHSEEWVFGKRSSEREKERQREMLVLMYHLNIVSFLNLSSCCTRRYTQHLIVFLILHHFRLPLRLPAVLEFGSHTKSRRLGIWLLQSCSTAFTPNPNSAANSCAMQKHPQWSWNLDLEISLSKIPPRLRRCMFVCLFACMLACCESSYSRLFTAADQITVLLSQNARSQMCFHSLKPPHGTSPV